MQEILALLAVMTGDGRFEEVFHEEGRTGEGKEIRTMCDVLDRIEEKGRTEGRTEGQAEMAVNLYKQGVQMEVIAMAAGVDVKDVEKWLGLALA